MLLVVPLLTVLKVSALRKETPMSHKANRSNVLFATIETLWAIGASYAAGMADLPF